MGATLFLGYTAFQVNQNQEQIRDNPELINKYITKTRASALTGMGGLYLVAFSYLGNSISRLKKRREESR